MDRCTWFKWLVFWYWLPIYHLLRLQLRQELSNFGPEFFDEIEDLKFNYREAMKKVTRYEGQLKQLSDQFGVSVSLSWINLALAQRPGSAVSNSSAKLTDYVEICYAKCPISGPRKIGFHGCWVASEL